MTGRWSRVRAVACLELRVQRREPLTVLYVLVFMLLAMAFAASGPVELVRDRGAVPRDAPWSLMFASTAITAFGQVITTMVAATVVLRDRADRVADLLVTTRLVPAEYRLAKLMAALVMLSVIYAAIPIGLVCGALLGGGSVTGALRGTLPPFAVVVLPTMIAVGAMQFAVGVLSGRLWVIVGQGLILIWLWTAAVDGVAGYGKLAALFDPFGSAPLLLATRGWSDAERMREAMPFTPLLLASRGLWMAIGAALATVAVLHEPSRRAAHMPGENSRMVISTASPSALPLVRASPPHWWAGLLGTARYVARWMLRDAGWRVLALLGAMNVAVHAAGSRGEYASADAQALGALQEHARLFLILLATIYAGELVWREREERSEPLFGGLPIAEAALATGRIAGVVVAQVVLVSALALAAVFGVAVSGELASPALLPDVAGRVLLPFVAWMLVSLVVQVIVGQKVVAHLLCIAAWVVGSLWLDAASPTAEAGVAVSDWAGVCLLAWCVVLLSWRRDSQDRRLDRRSGRSRPLV